MEALEPVAAILGVVALAVTVAGGFYAFGRWLSRAHRDRIIEDETFQRVAQWFPVEEPNGRESLPRQVEVLDEKVGEILGLLKQVRVEQADSKSTMMAHMAEDRQSFDELREQVKKK